MTKILKSRSVFVSFLALLFNQRLFSLFSICLETVQSQQKINCWMESMLSRAEWIQTSPDSNTVTGKLCSPCPGSIVILIFFHILWGLRYKTQEHHKNSIAIRFYTWFQKEINLHAIPLLLCTFLQFFSFLFGAIFITDLWKITFLCHFFRCHFIFVNKYLNSLDENLPRNFWDKLNFSFESFTKKVLNLCRN